MIDFEWFDISKPGGAPPDLDKLILLCDAVSKVGCLGMLKEADGDVCFFTVTYIDPLPVDFNVTHWAYYPEIPE